MGQTGKRIVAVLIAAAFVFGFALKASAEITMDDLLKRIEKLEAENAALKADVVSVQAKQMAPSSMAQAATAPAGGNFLKTGLDIAMYGFIRADVIYGSNDLGSSNIGGNQYYATRPTSAGQDDREVQLVGQDTRIGFDFKAPDLDNGAKVTGKIELDFAGNTTTQGLYTPRLRLAYAQIDFDKWAVNAGQNWDLFSPLNPSTINCGTMWRSGNIGSRHAQAQLDNKWGEVLGGKLYSKVGVIDSDETIQEDSGIPVSAAYIGYDKEIMGVKSTIGVGGMYGYLNGNGKGIASQDIHATTLGMTLKFTDWLAFKTEGYIGSGLNKFMGGPGQTLDTNSALGLNKAKPVVTRGGFMEVTVNPTKKLASNTGIGVDDPNGKHDTYTAADKAAIWDKNVAYYTNLQYSLSKNLSLGLEFETFQTKWLDGLKAHDQRVQSSLVLKF